MSDMSSSVKVALPIDVGSSDQARAWPAKPSVVDVDDIAIESNHRAASPFGKLKRITRTSTQIEGRLSLKYSFRWLLLACLLWFCVLAALSNVACAQTATGSAPAFPKYQVIGVVYAPPGSASYVTYGNSNLVGSTNTMSVLNSQTTINTTTVTAQTGIQGMFGVNASYSYSDGWTQSSENSNSIALQTTKGNSVATMGPISSSLGVDHDNDVIYIWLNPVWTGSVAGSTLNWTGLESNTCDPGNPSAPLAIDQSVNGCDPNQYPYPDIVGIPVWCLKNPYSPVQGCAQWLPYTSRSWDLSAWPIDHNTGLPLGPALTMRDYADILQADPFVALNGNAVNVCHPTYGPGLDPNSPETIGAPITPSNGTSYTFGGSTTLTNYADPYDPLFGTACSSSNTPACATGFLPHFCNSTPNNSTTTMSRFQPYGAVEYPVPGPNGLPSTYSGNFQYSNTQTNTIVATDSHTVSQSVSVGAWGTVPFFNASVTAGYTNSTTSQQQSSVTNTNGTTASAAYSITGPQLSDNYTGPATYNVYLDNVYGTFAFYSDIEQRATPAELGTIGINVNSTTCSPSSTSATVCASFPATQVGTTGPTTLQVTLTNNSTSPMTMAGPAITFSDSGFALVENNASYPDFCSNQQLSAYGTSTNGQNYTCTAYIQFAPVPSDMPNPVGTNVTVTANIIAAGTVSISTTGSNQNILVTNYGIISGTATPPANSLWATLIPNGSPTSSVPNAYIFPSILTYASTQSFTPETFTFTNKSNYAVQINASPTGVVLTDAADFSISSDNCTGHTIAPTSQSGNTCTITLSFAPSLFAASGTFATRITVNGTAATVLSPVQAIAGATVNAVTPAFTVTPQSSYYQNPSGSIVIPLSGVITNGTYAEANYAWAMPVTITNNTGATLTFVQPGSATEISEAYPSRDGLYTCESDAATTTYGDVYFSPCVYETSAATTTPELVGSMVTNTPIPAPWGYVFGQLSGTPGGQVASPGYSGPMNAASSNSPHAYGGGTDSSNINSWTEPGLTCGATLPPYPQTGYSCTGAVVAFVPSAPDDQPWNSIVFDLNGPTYTPSNTFVANFSLPISAKFPTTTGPFLVGQNLSVAVYGEDSLNNPPGSVTQVVTISGKEQSAPITTPATSATGALTITSASGPSNGALSVQVGSFKAAVPYAAGATTSAVLQDVANALNAAGSPVKATANGSSIALTSLNSGAAGDLALSVTGGGEFLLGASGERLTGGTNAIPATNATGSIAIRPVSAGAPVEGTLPVQVGSFKAVASYPAGATPGTIAHVLAAALNGNGSPVKATASGTTISLTSVNSGTEGDLALVRTGDSEFVVGVSGRTLSGGSNEIPATNATGNITIQPEGTTAATKGTLSVQVGAFKATAPYAAGATASAVVKGLVAALNAPGSPVKATAIGNVISLTSTSSGTAANLALTGMGDLKFALNASGKTLTGGKNLVAATSAAGSLSVELAGGTLSVQLGAFKATVPHASGAATGAVVENLVQALNATGSPVKATASGDLISLVSKSTGTAANLAFTVTGDSKFVLSGSGKALTGGKAEVAATNATGSLSAGLKGGILSLQVGAFKAEALYAAGEPTGAVIQALVRAINVAGSPVRAAENGNVISLTSSSAGTAGNLALTVTGDARFAMVASGPALTGGKNATTTTNYDAGVVQLTTNGVTASATWAEGSTAETVAAALAGSVNQVAAAYYQASSSGAVVTLTPVSSKSSASTAANTSNPISLTVNDSAGFTPASFGAAMN